MRLLPARSGFIYAGARIAKDKFTDSRKDLPLLQDGIVWRKITPRNRAEPTVSSLILQILTHSASVIHGDIISSPIYNLL